MNRDTKQQIQLLLCAIGNRIDENPKVAWIEWHEAWEWLNDILGGLE